MATQALFANNGRNLSSLGDPGIVRALRQAQPRTLTWDGAYRALERGANKRLVFMAGHWFPAPCGVQMTRFHDYPFGLIGAYARSPLSPFMSWQQMIKEGSFKPFHTPSKRVKELEATFVCHSPL